MDIVLDRNTFWCDRVAFLEVENTMFTLATHFLMFTINIPGPYTQLGQSNPAHDKVAWR